MRDKFAAFIMTYERPEEVKSMISALLNQTLPPKKILVVDNSNSRTTEEVIKAVGDNRIDYKRVGHNSGPAGAAYVGLKQLAAEGFDWIYWGDDNDPPRTPDSFARILEIKKSQRSNPIGALALMGNQFSLSTVKFSLFREEELKGIMSVNSLAGGSMMVINGDVVRKGILPDPSLFFGYEELDYCLQIKKHGYDILIDADYYREQKELSKKVKLSRVERLAINSRKNSLWREYYSIRNLLIIVVAKNRSITGLIVLLFRVFVKIVLSYFKGIKFGLKYTRVAISALKDFIAGKRGLVVIPGSV